MSSRNKSSLTARTIRNWLKSLNEDTFMTGEAKLVAARIPHTNIRESLRPQLRELRSKKTTYIAVARDADGYFYTLSPNGVSLQYMADEFDGA